jgi:pyrroloquinoline quinone biosynthesis protein B
VRWATLALVAVASCAAPRALPSEPFLVVLGTAQDGGFPQVGCTDALCARARSDAQFHRNVASLAIVDPRTGQRWWIDATPDLGEQVALADELAPRRRSAEARPPLFDGVFLTHAHIGHYAGLAQLGREVYGARGVPVWCTPRMRGFLESNGPWSLLVQTRAIELRETAPGSVVELAPDLSVESMLVPHRDEFSDTVGFIVRGPRHSVAYIPDIDKWERWATPLEALLADVDLALLDGTFFGDGEVPGRAMAEIPHPFIAETLARLSGLTPELRRKVVFTHLNHTNPACDPRSDATRTIEAAGMRAARDGELVALGAR